MVDATFQIVKSLVMPVPRETALGHSRPAGRLSFRRPIREWLPSDDREINGSTGGVGSLLRWIRRTRFVNGPQQRKLMGKQFAPLRGLRRADRG